MKKLSIILLIIIASTIYVQANDFIPYPATDFSKDTAFPVLSVIDGDTVHIKYLGKKTSVRLIGVDTPETVHPSKPVEPYGKEAAAFLQNLLKEESVYLRFDTEKTDKYNRLLAYLYRAPDGLFVNLEIVRQGYGHAYTEFPFKHMALFEHYGARAQEVGKGLYGVEAIPLTVKELNKLPVPSIDRSVERLDRAWLNRIYPNANKVGTTKVSTENQSSSKPEISSSKYPACKVCGGGSVVTKYGKKSHSSTCRYVTNTKYPTRSKSSYSSSRVRVKGYYRKDGTYVRPHTRRKPRR